jgi:hypothetical protein
MRRVRAGIVKLWSDLRALLFPVPAPPTSHAPGPAETESAALPTRDPPRAPPPDPVVAGSPDLESRRQRAAERLLDDERLRGDLTDEEFQPLLDWALTAIDRVVVAESDQDVDAAMDQIRTVIQAISDALVSAPDITEEDFAAQLRVALDSLAPPLVPARVGEADRQAVLADVREIAGQKADLSGPEIAERLAKILGDVTAGAPEASS